MSRLRKSLAKVERFRVNMSVTIGALVLIGTISLKYPLVFLTVLILGLIYSVYRIIKDDKKANAATAGNDRVNE